MRSPRWKSSTERRQTLQTITVNECRPNLPAASGTCVLLAPPGRPSSPSRPIEPAVAMPIRSGHARTSRHPQDVRIIHSEQNAWTFRLKRKPTINNRSKRGPSCQNDTGGTAHKKSIESLKNGIVSVTTGVKLKRTDSLRQFLLCHSDRQYVLSYRDPVNTLVHRSCRPFSHCN